MKIAIVIFISCIMTLSSIAQTQNATVPPAVLKSFSDQYHGSTPPEKWTRAHDTLIAKFKTDRETRVAYYLSDGSWIKTMTRLRSIRNLPAPVKHGFNQTKFAACRVDDINFIESSGKSYYTISVLCENGPQGSIPGDRVDRNVLYFYSDGTNFKTDHIEQVPTKIKITL